MIERATWQTVKTVACRFALAPNRVYHGNCRQLPEKCSTEAHHLTFHRKAEAQFRLCGTFRRVGL